LALIYFGTGDVLCADHKSDPPFSEGNGIKAIVITFYVLLKLVYAQILLTSLVYAGRWGYSLISGWVNQSIIGCLGGGSLLGHIDPPEIDMQFPVISPPPFSSPPWPRACPRGYFARLFYDCLL
jgi:hypothetical protein